MFSMSLRALAFFLASSVCNGHGSFKSLQLLQRDASFAFGEGEDEAAVSDLLWDNRSEGVDGAAAPSAVMEEKADPILLVVAATHGAGTTMLSEALAKHPCIISVGEPFSASEKLYAPNGHLDANGTALFRNDSRPDPKGTFSKLAGQINEAVGTKVELESHLHIQEGNIMKFFAAVRKASCAQYSLAPACEGRCVFSHKLFPDYISDDFEQIRHYLTDDRTAVLHMMRNEEDVIASNTRRFNGYSAWKQFRDLKWHEFLSGLSNDLGHTHVWEEIHAEDVFRSSRDYYQALSNLFSALNLNADPLVSEVRKFVEFKFALLAASNHTSR